MLLLIKYQQCVLFIVVIADSVFELFVKMVRLRRTDFLPIVLTFDLQFFKHQTRIDAGVKTHTSDLKLSPSTKSMLELTLEKKIFTELSMFLIAHWA